MKRNRYMVCVLAFLLSLLLLYTNSIVHAQTDMGLQNVAGNILDQIDDSETINDNVSSNIEALTLLVATYSEQLEEYDRSNGVFVITCISFCGVVLGLAITFVTQRKEVKRPNLALAAVFALLPAIMTLCLYVFSMQCRRVAIFRGYLSYLEEKLSVLTGVPMVFNSSVVPKFFGEFWTNKYGPFVMSAFIILLFIASGWLCAYFANSSSTIAKSQQRRERVARVILIAVFILCMGFCGICVFDLATNGPIPNEVCEYCKNVI